MAEPIKLNFENGKTYTLDFSRRTLNEAVKNGFNVKAFGENPYSDIPELFYWSLKKHQPAITEAEADTLFDELGGLTEAEIARLGDIIKDATTSLVASEEKRKNLHLTVTM